MLKAAIKVLFAAAVIAAGPCGASTSSDFGALREFGVIGNWAPDCDRYQLGEHEVFSISPPDRPTLRYTPGVPNQDRVYYIVSAERIADDRLQLRLGLEPGIVAVEIILQKSAGAIRVWSSRDRSGRMLVMDGLITGNGRPSPQFQRCAP
jgi:hypothetical protein